MGFYQESLAPRLLHFCLGLPNTAPLREGVCMGLAGSVLEIGFGSGSNVPFYPREVASVTAIEPSDVGWRLARKRLTRSAVPVSRAGLDGQCLPFEDNTFDAALSTWTLCSIPDASAALAEVWRVLRPAAALHFLEHGRAPDPRVRRIQRLMLPLQMRAFAGCDFTKPIPELLIEAGFELHDVRVFYQPWSPKYVGANTSGLAVKG